MGGAALLLQCSPLADKWPIKFLTQILAVLMLVPAIAVLAEQLLGSASQFEHFFLLFTWSGMSGFAEMHPFVAVGFIFSGVALLVLDYRTQRQHYPAEHDSSHHIRLI